MTHKLPDLPYSYDALEPYIDAETMKLHHTKHHQGYVDKLNTALQNYSHLQKKPVEELLKILNSIPKEIRTIVVNHGGGHFNHSFWWPILKKDVKFKGEIAEEIKKTFSSFEKFKEEFKNVALSRFGSGWAWLVLHNGKLEIYSTPNQDCPLSEGKIPILGIDMWEHSFYKMYGPDKVAYINAFFNVINWDKVNDYYENAQ